MKPYLASALLLPILAGWPVWSQSSPNPDPPSQPDPLAVNPLTGLTSTSASNYQPLTGSDRWKLYWKQNYWSAGAYVGPVLSALILDEATGSPYQYGGGIEGFGKRLGSRTLTAMVQGTFQAALAAPLHEDVRYISSGQGGFMHRTKHAIVYSFLTYNNHGHATLNISNLTSYYASTALSTTWVPTNEPLGRYTLVHGTENMALSIPVNLIQEFWPEIRQKVFRRH